MAVGEVGDDGGAEGERGKVHRTAHAEGVEQVGHLASEQGKIVGCPRAVGPPAPVVVEPDHAEPGAAEALEE